MNADAKRYGAAIGTEAPISGADQRNAPLGIAAKPMIVVFAFLITFCVSALHAAPPTTAQFTLITSELESVPIRLLSINTDRLHFTHAEHGDRMSRPLAECIALLKESPSTPPSVDPGMLRLTDGRQFPGAPGSVRNVTNHNASDVFAWHSNWLGRMDVRIDSIDWIVVASGVSPPRISPGGGDVVMLTNGDILEGFIVSIREKLVLEGAEAAGPRMVEIPMDRIAAINLVAPGSGASTSSGETPRARAWLTDGTIMNISRVEIDTTGGGSAVSITSDSFTNDARLDVRHIAAILLSPNRMMPLASMEPKRITGPETRYVIPPPRILDASALLGLARIEYRGPLQAEYALPAGATRFAAEAILPAESRQWGEFEVVVSVDGLEIVREAVNAARPRVSINAPISGETLTIELTAGAHGPIQNHLVLQRAMVLVD